MKKTTRFRKKGYKEEKKCQSNVRIYLIGRRSLWYVILTCAAAWRTVIVSDKSIWQSFRGKYLKTIQHMIAKYVSILFLQYNIYRKLPEKESIFIPPSLNCLEYFFAFFLSIIMPHYSLLFIGENSPPCILNYLLDLLILFSIANLCFTEPPEHVLGTETAGPEARLIVQH